MSDRRRSCRIIAALACAVVCCLTAVLDAEDWPQWRGIDRAAVWRETGIVERFAEGGLIVKWRTPVHAGFAGPAVADGRVFVLDYQETPGSRTMDGHERLVVLDEETGAVLWAREWPATYRNIVPVFATGPRATPTVDGDRVYILGAAGMLSCFDTASGDPIWQIDTVADYDVTVPVYGVAHSPIVDGELLITLLGGEPDAMVVAFDKATGAEAWRALDTNSEAGYSSPIVTTAGGVRQLIVWHPAGVTSLDPATGRTWWEHDFPIASGLTIGTPVRSGRYLLITQVENAGLMLALNPDRPGGAGGLDRHQPQPHRPPGAAIHDVDAHRGGRCDLRAQQLRRAARRGRDHRRAAVVERPPRTRGPLGELTSRAAPGPLFHLRRDRRAGHRPLHADRLRGGRPHAPADAHHPHPGRRLQPLEKRRPAPSCGRIRRSRTATSLRATTPRSSACR